MIYLFEKKTKKIKNYLLELFKIKFMFNQSSNSTSFIRNTNRSLIIPNRELNSKYVNKNGYKNFFVISILKKKFGKKRIFLWFIFNFITINTIEDISI